MSPHDLIEFSDPFQGLGGSWRRRRFGDVEPLPVPMCPTERERSRPAGALRIGKAAVGGIAVGLQHASVALQQPYGVFIGIRGSRQHCSPLSRALERHGSGQGFQSCRDVDAVPEDVVFLNDHVA